MSHTHESLTKEISDVLRLQDSPDLEGKPGFYVASRYACEITDVVHGVASRMAGEGATQFKQELTAAALEAWDTVVVPYDVPGVPEVWEQMFEAQIRAIIPGMVAKVHDEILARV